MYIIKVNCISKIYSSKRKAHFFDLLKTAQSRNYYLTGGVWLLLHYYLTSSKVSQAQSRN